MEKEEKISYEVYWKNGLKSENYYKLAENLRTILGVQRLIIKTCNHSEGSNFKVFEVKNGIKNEITKIIYTKI